MSEGGATRISMAEWLERPGSVGTPWPGRRGPHPRRRRQRRSRRARPGSSTCGRRAVSGSRTTTIPRRPRRRGATTRSPSATSVISTPTATSILTDRAADMVIRGGVNIYPREIEEVLHAHPAVVDCAVFGVPDDRLGEQLHAVVEVRSAGHDRRAARALPSAPRRLQGARDGRARRRAAAPAQRQGAQARAPRPALGRPRRADLNPQMPDAGAQARVGSGEQQVGEAVVVPVRGAQPVLGAGTRGG